jgi:RimJ/RimL family protein N-acetyltransferase
MASQRERETTHGQMGLHDGVYGREILAGGGIELRLGDPKVDAKELARLFTQESTMLHLSGVVPYRLNEEERQEIDNRYPGIPLITATASDVRQYYQKNRNQILIVAHNPKVEGKLSGAVAVQGGNPGVLAGNISKLVVDEVERGQGIGPDLVRSAKAFIFGYLNFERATATVVLNVPNDRIPQKVLRDEGFQSQPQVNRGCVSWDTEKGMLVVRDVLPFLLERDAYFKRANVTGEMEKYLAVLYDFP